MPKINFTKRLLSIFLLAFFLSANSTLAFNPDLLANAINSTGNSLTNIYQSYIISPLSDLLISIFNLSDTPVEVSTTPPVIKLPTATTTTENTVTTLPPNSGLQIRGTTSLPASGVGPKGDKGDKGDTGPQGPAGRSSNIDTSNFVDSAFFDKQVDGILSSIESGVSGLSSALGEEVGTVLLNVSGISTLSGGAVIGSAITGTGKALVVNNNTSIGNIAEFQDNGSAVVTIADGGNVGVGTSSPITQLHVAGKVPTVAIGSVGTGTAPERLFVQGRYAYVTNQTSATFQIFDVSNPATPVLMSTLSIGANPRASYVQGKYAYVTSLTNATLQIIDISNPTSPIIVGSVATTLNYDVYVQGRYAYLVGNNGLEVIDVANPVSPVRVGVVAGFSNPRQLYVHGSYAYVTNAGNATLSVVDISNPVAPSIVGSTATGTGPQGVSVQGRYAYVANFNSNTLQIFDISNPAAPTSIGSVATSARPYRISVQGRYLYVNEDTSGALHIFDISDPITPTSVGSTTAVGGQAYDVVVQGRYAYTISRTTNILQIFDVGGAYVQQLETGGIETGTLTLRNNLQVGNDADISGGLVVGRGANITGHLSAMGNLTVTQNATDLGALKGIVYTGAVNTNQTASTEIPSLTLTTAGRQWVAGAIATQREVLITQPTYSFAGASTITNAATVGIAGAPIASTNATLTNSHGLLIQAGAVGAGTTNSYGLTVNAQTGAANNYAAQFMGGNVGIGTAAPSYKLDVSGRSDLTIASTAAIVLEDTSGNANSRHWAFGNSWGSNFGDLNFSVGASAGATPVAAGIKMTINRSGDVGIGTSGPLAKLHTISDNRQTYFASGSSGVVVGTGGTDGLAFWENGSSGAAYIGNLYDNTGGTLNFVTHASHSTNNIVAMTIKDGNVGIGTTTPVGQFQVHTTTTDNILKVTNATTGSALGDGFMIQQQGLNAYLWNFEAGALQLATSNASRINIDSLGAVTIGNNNLGASSKALVVNNGATSTGNIFEAQDGGTAVFTVADGGAVALGSVDLGNGVAGPVITLGRNTNATNTGAGSINYLSKAGTAGYVWQDAAGNMRINTSAPSNANDTSGTVIGAQTSTRETKQDIEDYTDYNDALNLVLDAPLHTFRYIKEVQGYGTDSPLAKTRLGYIADEVSPMFMVGNSIDQVSVNGLLIASIKALDINLNAISGTITPETGSVTETFVTAFFDNIFVKVGEWLASATNGITNIFANTFNAKESICVDGECLNKEDVRALLLLAHPEGTPEPAPTPTPEPEPAPEPTPADPTCSDGIQNQDETGVDTGGVCTPAPVPEPTPEPAPEIVP